MNKSNQVEAGVFNVGGTPDVGGGCCAGGFVGGYVHVVQCRATKVLLTQLRDKNSDARVFSIHLDRVCRILAEEGLAADHIIQQGVVETPCGKCTGFWSPNYDEMCAISIMRSGDLLLEAVKQVVPGIPVGKILIQRDESDPEKRAKLFYSKLPADLGQKRAIFLVDPMLATGGSANKAIEVLLENGVREEQITFLNMIACPEGIANLHHSHPKVHVVTLAIDACLNAEKFICPGLGDAGDRAMST